MTASPAQQAEAQESETTQRVGGRFGTWHRELFAQRAEDILPVIAPIDHVVDQTVVDRA